MKSYTDIDQSKKLSEILSFESADMYWRSLNLNGHISWTSHIKRLEPPLYDFEHYAPCWSLAALTSIIPQELFGGEYIINITEGLDYKWIISYESRYEVSSYIDASSDNLIDCCVEMIIKLKERNLLRI